MASKTRKRRQKELRKHLALASSQGLSVNDRDSEKKRNTEVRSNKKLKHKHKIRLGHKNSYDIYEEFAEKQTHLQQGNICYTCQKSIRTKGFCVWCGTVS